MTVSADLVLLANALVDPAQRLTAAEQLAQRFRARELLVFVRDREVDTFVTVPRMRQRLPDGWQWQAFLTACLQEGQKTADLSLLVPNEQIGSLGFRASENVVVVFVGMSREGADLAAFRVLLPLIGASFEREHDAAVAEAQKAIAEEAARRAERLSSALDKAREQMTNLHAELRIQTTRLEDANRLLQDQNLELEAQAAELEAARQRADTANRAKSEFLTTMSHELRTPLNAISGYVQLLQIGIHGPLTPEQSDFLDRIYRSHEHLLHLINDVLNFARIEARVVEYELTDTDLRAVVAEIEPLIAPQVAAKGLSYQVHVPQDAVVARVDFDKLRQILLNLISNAIKFTPAGGHIVVTIALDTEQRNARISIKDTGIGIPADKLSAIFDPFVQVQSGLTRNVGGTGLGLAISRDLATGMGGHLTVESEVGAGSTFTVSLPTTAAHLIAS